MEFLISQKCYRSFTKLFIGGEGRSNRDLDWCGLT